METAKPNIRMEDRARIAQSRIHFRAIPQAAWWLLALGIVGLLQVWMVMGPGEGLYRADLAIAALLKPIPDGEWWRLATSPLLHGSLLHLAANGMALYALVGLMERMAPRWWTGLVWLVGALAGGLASVLFTDGPAVGASGGIVAWMGFAGVLAWRWQMGGLRSGILQGLVLTAVLGALLPEQIDNAAHGGGLVAGALLGWIYAIRTEAGARAGKRPGPAPVAERVVLGLLVLQLGWTGFVMLRVVI